MRNTTHSTALLSLLAAALLGSCSNTGDGLPGNGGGGGGGGGGSTGLGTYVIDLTDAPFEYGQVTAATIYIDRVQLSRAPNAEMAGGFLTLYVGAPMAFNLVPLRNGVTEELVRSLIPAGEYLDVYLHIAAAEIELIDGQVFSSMDGTLDIPDGDDDLLLRMDQRTTVTADETRRVLIDFDLMNSFIPRPLNQPMSADFFELSPRARIADQELTGSVSGMVTALEVGERVRAENATVWLLPADETNHLFAWASSATEENGLFTFLGVEPGTYDMAFHLRGEELLIEDVVVQLDTETIVDADL